MSSRTTIQIDRETLTLLEHYRKEKAFRNYSEVIRKLLQEYKKIPRSEKGSLPKLEPFKREKIDRFA
jgi:Arc/MetJ-type ribon-helix-helix transcriptional regulator